MSSLVNYVWDGCKYFCPYVPSIKSLFTPPISNQSQLNQAGGNTPLGKAILEDCFSRYAKNLVAVDENSLTQISQAIKRSAISKEIANKWDQLAYPGYTGKCIPMGATHQAIGSVPLAKEAIAAQCIWEKELLRLKTIDRLELIQHEKIDPQIDLMKREIRAIKSLWSIRWYNNDQKKFIKNLADKAKHYGRTVVDQLTIGIQEKKQLIQRLKQSVQVFKQLKKSESPFINSESGKLKGLLKYFQRSEAPSIFLERAEGVDQSILNHYVFPFTDPVMDENAVFVILKKDKIPDEVWLKCISQEGTEILRKSLGKDFQKKHPSNKEFQVLFSDKGKQWPITTCYEPVSGSLISHEDRDFHMKTRRDVVEPGKYQRINREDEKGFSGAFKNWWRQTTQGNWSESRRATAGVDCHQAILMNRQMISHVLNGNLSKIKQKDVQNIGEYFDALTGSDIGKLKGGYMSYRPFMQAVNLQKFLYGGMTQHFREKTLLPHLDRGLESNYSWKNDLGRIGLLSQSFFESYSSWAESIEVFIREVKRDSKVSSLFPAKTIVQLEGFLVELRSFLNQSMPNEIKEAIKDRKEIVRKYDARKKDLNIDREKVLKKLSAQPQRLQEEYDRFRVEEIKLNKAQSLELDEVWASWKRNHTPEQMDAVINKAMLRIREKLKVLTPYLVVLSVPFSSQKRQNELGEAMSKVCPHLVPLYQKAIPRLWTDKVKIQTTVPELMKGTEMSVLWFNMLKLMDEADHQVVKNEFIRSRLAKGALEFKS